MRSKKRSFLMSLTSLILSVAMLVGSTFAWFTDTVTSGNNRIVAGNLDIDLLMDKVNGGTAESYVSIAGETGDIFKEADKAQNSNATLWEPGKTQFAKLAVENKGNLAVKYTAYIDVKDEGLCVGSESGKSSLEYAMISYNEPGDISGLSTLTNWSTVKGAIEANGGVIGDVAAGRTTITSGVLDEITKGTKNERDYVLLAVHMKEEAGNEYQGKDAIIDVTIVATQKDAEKDAFGPDYDESAEGNIPDAPTKEETVSKKIVTDQDTVIKSAVTPGEESGKQTTVTFPKEIKEFASAANKEATMTIEATPIVAANQKFTISTGNGAVGAIDLTVKVDGTQVEEFKDSNEQPVEVIVKTFIAKGLTLDGNENKVGVEYKGELTEQPTFVSYNSSTGELVFKTKHFSQFLIAADQVAYVKSNNTAYKQFDDAMSVCENNDTIYMLKNYKYSDSPSYVYNKKAKYTIDLNGCILDFNDSGYGLYVLKNQTVTLNDSVGTGQLKNRQCLIYGNDGSSVIINGGHLGGVDKDQATIYGYGNVTVNGGVIDTAKKNGYDYYAVMIGNYTNDGTPARFVMTDGQVNGSLYINGNDKDSNTIDISGGEINGNSYIAGRNTTNISGGEFKGTTCFYYKAGTINISGGKFTAIKGDGDWQHKDSSCTNTGDAVIIEACNYPNGNPTANITGGTFKGYKEEGGTEPTSGNIYFKNYGILVINYAENNNVDMSGTTVSYRKADVPSNSAEGFVTENGYIHFTDENTQLMTPNAE